MKRKHSGGADQVKVRKLDTYPLFEQHKASFVQADLPGRKRIFSTLLRDGWLEGTPLNYMVGWALPLAVRQMELLPTLFQGLYTAIPSEDIEPYYQKLVCKVAWQCLEGSDATLRHASLLVLSVALPILPSILLRFVLTVLLLVQDVNQRVRECALQVLLTLHSRGYDLPVDLILEGVLEAAKDRHIDTRLASLRVLWTLACQRPSSSSVIFTTVCNAVMDHAVEVRQLACSLLGSFPDVHPRLVLQTFSKRVLNAKGAHSQVVLAEAREGEVDVDLDAVELITPGAAGAFVHALEDEFAGVRAAALDSICGQCALQGSDEITSTAIAFVLDMLHDDIDHIRLHAVSALRRITSFPLTTTQIGAVLPLCSDSHAQVRHAATTLIRDVSSCEQSGTLAAMHALVREVGVHPAEDILVLSALASLCHRHPYHCKDIFSYFLGVPPGVKAPEPFLDDLRVIAGLVAMVSTAQAAPELVHRLPWYWREHVAILSRRYPFLKQYTPPEGTTSSAPFHAALVAASELVAAGKLEAVSSILRFEAVQLESAMDQFSHLYATCYRRYLHCASLPDGKAKRRVALLVRDEVAKLLYGYTGLHTALSQALQAMLASVYRMITCPTAPILTHPPISPPLEVNVLSATIHHPSGRVGMRRCLPGMPLPVRVAASLYIHGARDILDGIVIVFEGGGRQHMIPVHPRRLVLVAGGVYLLDMVGNAALDLGVSSAPVEITVHIARTTPQELHPGVDISPLTVPLSERVLVGRFELFRKAG